MATVHAVEADLFRALAHPARLRLLELLGERRMSVGELQALCGSEGGTTSQHLAALRRQGLIAAHKQKTSVFYEVKDVRTQEILRLGREIISDRLSEGQALLDQLSREAPEETPG